MRDYCSCCRVGNRNPLNAAQAQGQGGDKERQQSAVGVRSAPLWQLRELGWETSESSEYSWWKQADGRGG